MTLLPLISDIFLIVATVGVALHVHLTMRRMRAVNEVDPGLGGAVSALSTQVDSLRGSLDGALADARSRADTLETALARADDKIGRLEMLIATAEDLEASAYDAARDEPTERDDQAERDAILADLLGPERAPEAALSFRPARTSFQEGLR